MKEFMDKLKSRDDLHFCSKADVHHNIDARKYLTEENMAVFPDEFFSLVKYANGIVGTNARLYGISPDSEDDVVRKNEQLNRADKSTVAVLGSNAFDYLVYDTLVKQYQLRDRIDDMVIHSFDTLPPALVVLFGVR